MSNIRRRRWGEVEPEVQKVFAAFHSARGNVPNLFRVLAHSPPLLRSFNAHFNTAMGPGRLEIRLKELIALRVSQLNECRY